MEYYLELFLEVIPFVTIAAAVYGILRAMRLKRRGLSRDNWFRECIRLAFVCYMAGLLALVWAPNGMWSGLWLFLRYGWPMECWGMMFRGEYNFDISFLGLVSGQWVRSMLLGNVLMFIPLGLLLPLRWPRLTMPKALAAGICIDLAIEVVQPVFGRSFDVEDLICNTLGILLGVGIYLLLRLAAPQFVCICQEES